MARAVRHDSASQCADRLGLLGACTLLMRGQGPRPVVGRVTVPPDAGLGGVTEVK